MGYILIKLYDKLYSNIQPDVDEVEENTNILFLSAEFLQNNIYLFDADTDKFICQGKDFKELMENFGIKCPSNVGTIVTMISDSESQQSLEQFKQDAKYLQV